jgi:uncharacterized membrane-anchored protein
MAAHPVVAQTDAQWAEIKRMNWQDAASVPLKMANAIVRLPGFIFLVGDEARRYRAVIDGSGNVSINLEAVALHRDVDSEFEFSWSDAGHVKMDDWGDVDADAFMKQIQANDAEANNRRAAAGLKTLTTTGWRQKPTLNRDLHTVFWTIDAVDSAGDRLVNAIALKLGRTGFQRIVWITTPELYGSRSDLLTTINNHAYNPSSRFTDYVEGKDRVAAYGVAGLVAGTLGVKLVKSAGIAAVFALLIAFLKKGAWLILLPIFAGFSWLTRRRSK